MKNCKQCKGLDHYKCTRIKDHKAGKHKLGMWWCELCTPYLGEVGEVYKVNYVPAFMLRWPSWLVEIGCFTLNHLPSRLANKIERYLDGI